MTPEQYLELHRHGAPEEHLAAEVLKTAFFDAVAPATTRVSRPEHEQAVRFLTAEQGSWAQARVAWCTAAGVCPDWLRDVTLRRVKPAPAPPAPEAPPRPTPAPQPPPEPPPPRKKIRGHISILAKERLVACRQGTRLAALVDALKAGATWEQLRAICPNWAEASVQYAIYDDLSRRKGYGLRTEVHDGVPIFYLVYPEGITEPPQHR